MADLFFPVLGGASTTSGLGARSSPGGIGSTNHKGIDLGAALGTGVVAPTDLTVTYVGKAGGYGNLIKARGADGNEYRFAHLSSIGVQSGQQIAGGSPIGAVGSTGNSTGNHLHFEVRDAAGKVLNPSKLLSGAKTLLEAGKGLANRARGIVEAVPGGAVVTGATDAIGLTGDCNLLCQFRKWIEESGFFVRVAMALLAFILLFGAFMLFKSGSLSKVAENFGNS